MNLQRELNPLLFGDLGQDVGCPDPKTPALPVMGKAAIEPRAPYPPLDVDRLERQIAMMESAIHQLTKRTDQLAAKMEELAHSVHARMERFSKTANAIEEAGARQGRETAAKFERLSTRFSEAEAVDRKVQEMIDRHNMVVRGFENRLLSLQRLISEQEMALRSSPR